MRLRVKGPLPAPVPAPVPVHVPIASIANLLVRCAAAQVAIARRFAKEGWDTYLAGAGLVGRARLRNLHYVNARTLAGVHFNLTVTANILEESLTWDQSSTDALCIIMAVQHNSRHRNARSCGSFWSGSRRVGRGSSLPI